MSGSVSFSWALSRPHPCSASLASLNSEDTLARLLCANERSFVLSSAPDSGLRLLLPEEFRNPLVEGGSMVDRMAENVEGAENVGFIKGAFGDKADEESVFPS